VKKKEAEAEAGEPQLPPACAAVMAQPKR